MSARISSARSAFKSSSATQMALAMYGAGMMPGISVSSANFSGVHLNERWVGAEGSRGMTANIFPATLNTRSSPHCTVSVACGSDRQCSRSQSMFFATSPYEYYAKRASASVIIKG